MRLYITEKPKTARQLCQVLGPARHVPSSAGTQFAGHKEGDGWKVAWLSGHFYRLLMPDEFPQWRRWSLSSLPFYVDQWHWVVEDSNTFPPKHEIEEQIAHIQSLYETTDELILATDGDQEGQVLGQVFLEQSGWKGPVRRLWTDLWEQEGLQRALSNVTDNSFFQGVYDAGLCRKLADQILGCNLTRIFTLKAREAGYNFTANTGRVISPSLVIIVRHNDRVKSHSAQQYYGAEAELTGAGQSFKANLCIPEQWCSDGKHCFSPEPITALIDDIDQEAVANVKEAINSKRLTPPPKPFTPNTLSQYCAKHHFMLPDEVSKAMQKLYEDGVMSYPRGESQVFERSVLDKAPGILDRLKKVGLGDEAAGANIDNAQPVFVDAAVDSHSALFITKDDPQLERRTVHERHVYMAVARRFIAQFYPDLVTGTYKLTLDIKGDEFIAERHQVIEPGWSIVEPTAQDRTENALPLLDKGQQCAIETIRQTAQKTKAPPRLTVDAFQEILRDCTSYLSPAIRQRIGSGQLGTGGTQHTYLKALLHQRFAQIQDKKYVIPTRRGEQLARLLPNLISSPDLTSTWELSFKKIRNREATKEQFLDTFKAWLFRTVEDCKALRFPPSPTMEPCPRCGCALTRKEHSKHRHHYFWLCCNTVDCGLRLPDKAGRPFPPLKRHGESCEVAECNGSLVTRIRKKDQKPFLACNKVTCNYIEETV